MNWFDNSNHKKIYPTKMFVNYLPEVSRENESKPQEKSIGGTLLSVALGAQNVALDMLLTAAPKLVEQGMNFTAKTLESLAVDKAFPTIVQRNFDVINKEHLSLPSKITLVRGDFTPNNSTKGELFADGETKSRNQLILTANKELHIEIDIIQSKDKSAIYFQANSYFYAGKSPEGHKIDEMVLAFAFIPAGQSVVNPEQDFKNFLHFQALNPNEQYNFKSESGYDTSFQSSWMTTPFEKVIPYTIVVQIQEIHEGNSFAKLLQTIYVENQENIKTKLNRQISIGREGQA